MEKRSGEEMRNLQILIDRGRMSSRQETKSSIHSVIKQLLLFHTSHRTINWKTYLEMLNFSGKYSLIVPIHRCLIEKESKGKEDLYEHSRGMEYTSLSVTTDKLTTKN